MSLVSDYAILAEDCPADIPSREDIIALCKAAGYDCRGIPFSSPSSGHISAWIKYGAGVTMAEARTQNMVANALNHNPDATARVPRVYQAFSKSSSFFPIGYIVMEYIDGPDCNEKDFELVAKAVQCLIGLKGPSTVPGHVGGGPVVHRFFDDWISPAPYETVKELEQHVNGMLRFLHHPRRVNLVDDAREGLYLCLSDVNPGNFKKPSVGDSDERGAGDKLVALDFGASCFLPPSFFAVAMIMSNDTFSWKVARLVGYQRSDPDDVKAMAHASYRLVPFVKSNHIGIPKSVRRRMSVSK